MANNPYVNKVVFGSATLVDLTGTTATADKILTGYGAFGADGAWMDGTATASSGSGVVWQDSQGYVHLSDEGDIPLQTKTVTPNETAQTITPDNGYYALDKVNVGAISSSYVGSGITRRSSSDLTASGATVTVPSGYYSTQASKAVASGTAGTPTATKGTVSNHAVSVTPSVTNTTGYITGGTKTGTAVSVSAAELVSGTYSVTGSGTKDVTNYASVSIPSGTEGTPTATKGTVSNHSVSVTPSVTNTTGYITGGTKNGTAVTVSASELVSGTYSVTSSGTKDVTNYASASVPSGTEGTPTASKGTVSNHAVSVTPSVTNSSGYITGGTKNGTAVTVSASELVSGTKSITENGTGIDVTNYANVDVAVQSGKKYYATITSTGSSTSAYVKHPSSSGTKYYTAGNSFEIQENDEIYMYLEASRTEANIYVNNEIVTSSTSQISYTYTVPSATNVEISLTYGNPSEIYLTEIKSELSITQNGSYDVSDYDWANVNVSGGVSNVVTGTFTPSADDAGTAQDIILPYSGSGYAKALLIVPEDGTFDSDTTIYNTIARYGCVMFSMSKAVNVAPTYEADSSEDWGVTSYKYKNSTTTASAVTNGGGTSNYLYNSSGANQTSATIVVFKSSTTLSYFTRGTSYGFIPDIEYRYWIVYSQ
jgi:hypothetical protein